MRSYLDESPNLPDKPSCFSCEGKNLLSNTILVFVYRPAMLIAPETLDCTVYQHKTTYRGVNQDNTSSWQHCSSYTLEVTPVRQNVNQTEVFPHLEISLESREQCGVRQYYRADRLVLPESNQPRVSKPGDSGNGVNNF